MPASVAKRKPAKRKKKKTNLESSVRFSEPVKKKYDTMALGNRGQKTNVIAVCGHRLVEFLLANPTAFRGAKRPWMKPAVTPPCSSVSGIASVSPAANG
jgi:hypothetical protein